MDTTTEVLKIFLDNPNTTISGQHISKTLGVSRNAVWKAIEQLRKNGYFIEGITNKGYLITQLPSSLDEYYIKAISTDFWKEIIFLDSTVSTNTLLKRLADNGQQNGTVMIAKEQTGGKGRLGRHWHSQLGGIWFSILLRPQLPMEELSLLTLAMAAGVQNGVSEYCGVNAQIKWPNDILINGKKVAGILTELKGDMDRVDYVIVGIGINGSNDIVPELKDKGIAIKDIIEKINLNELLLNVLNNIQLYYQKLIIGEHEEILNINKKNSSVIGKEIELATIRGTERGIVVDIASEGTLVINQNGQIKKVVSGDVSLSSNYETK